MKEKNKLTKISFTGDILCDYLELKNIIKHKYDFTDIFELLPGKDENEVLVGNLETPICPYMPYTFEYFSFNSPKAFVDALSKKEFDLLSIANNHCLDRGILGAKTTIKELKNNNIIPSGIYYTNEKNYDIVEKNNLKIAFISYTYGTNYSHNHCYLKPNSKIKINLLKQQKKTNEPKYNHLNYIYTFIKLYLKNTSLWKKIALIKHKIKKENYEVKKAHIIDDIDKNEWIIDEKYLEQIKKTIEKANKEADIVVLLLHSGGQFNGKVGTFTEKIIQSISQEKIDIIIGNHPHIVQKFKKINNKPVFYSLGNFIFSPKSEYINPENKPEYSLKINCYINEQKKISITYEIMKTVTDHQTKISKVINTYDLYQKEKNIELINDCNFIINRLYDTKEKKYINKLEKEYKLEME